MGNITNNFDIQDMQLTDKLSPNLTLKQAIASQTATRKGIDNMPTPEQIEKLKLWAINIYEPIKKQFPEAFITSFFRCLLLNRAVGSKDNSQHVKCEAGDIDSPASNQKIFDWIIANLDFDQLIFEGGISGWVHCSFKKTGNRKQVLYATFINGKAVYSPV